MITSMTGFGSIEKDNKDFSIEINIRSENNRFFDFNIKLPSSLLLLEKSIRELCKEKCNRGSIKVYLRIKTSETIFDFSSRIAIVILFRKKLCLP